MLSLFIISCEKNDDNTPNTQVELTNKLKKIYEESDLPGFSVAIVNDKNVNYQNSYGYADIKENIEFTSNTIQNIGSISKTFIAVAIMKAVEQGKLDLDTNINSYLPFEVTNPYHPGLPITVRHLATHTSGILDGPAYGRSYLLQNPSAVNVSEYPEEYQSYIAFLKTNIEIDDSVFLKKVLSQTGEWYTQDSFSENAPGTHRKYSNIAAALAAYVVEEAAGISYEEYIRIHILRPLQMDATGWGFDEVNMENYATLYFTKEFEVPRYFLITKADGGLITSSTDLSKFLIEMIKGYKGKGTLLSEGSYEEMFSYQSNYGISVAKEGIFWGIENTGEIGHSGGDPGILTFVSFDPEKNKGQLFITNISEGFDEDIVQSVIEIWDTITQNNF